MGVEREAVLLYLEQDSRGRPLRVSDRGIADLYVLSDALLFPSRQEGFGIPVLEAGLVRIPVFCTDIEPLRQLGADDAYYFDPDADPDSVAAMIEDWMHHSRAYRLRQRVLKRYTWQAIYDHYIEPLLLSEVRRKSNANH